MPRSGLHRAFLSTVLVFHLWELRRKMNKKLNTLEQLIITLETERARAATNGALNFVRITDASLFITLLTYDISVLRADHITQFRESRKNFYSRQLCLLIYEALEDLPSVLGKEFRQAVRNISNDEILINGLNLCTRKLSDLQKTYAVELKEIRIFAAAHREHNALSQLVVIRKVDDDKIGKIAAEVDAVLHEIVTWMIEITKLMGDFSVILKNINIPL